MLKFEKFLQTPTKKIVDDLRKRPDDKNYVLYSGPECFAPKLSLPYVIAGKVSIDM